VYGTSVCDIQQTSPLLGAERTCQFDFSIDLIHAAGRRVAFPAVRRMGIPVFESNDNLVERPFHPIRIHAQSYRCTRSQAGEQVLIRRRAFVAPTQSHRFIRG
jgi:hypothetical protein